VSPLGIVLGQVQNQLTSETHPVVLLKTDGSLPASVIYSGTCSNMTGSLVAAGTDFVVAAYSATELVVLAVLSNTTGVFVEDQIFQSVGATSSTPIVEVLATGHWLAALSQSTDTAGFVQVFSALRVGPGTYAFETVVPQTEFLSASVTAAALCSGGILALATGSATGASDGVGSVALISLASYAINTLWSPPNQAVTSMAFSGGCTWLAMSGTGGMQLYRQNSTNELQYDLVGQPGLFLPTPYLQAPCMFVESSKLLSLT
jgi:hypothetical protein